MLTAAEPHPLLGGQPGIPVHELVRHDPDIPLGELPEKIPVERILFLCVGQILRIGYRRHQILMLDTGVQCLK
ncbi:Uncharacterised protein [Mycobacteroides abscessus subsp. abscessus]|nr:Uncharacterised protein [Mycobacteroides abscessus subsp. abscessus]